MTTSRVRQTSQNKSRRRKRAYSTLKCNSLTC